MNGAKRQGKSLRLPMENEAISRGLPGYPLYPAAEDIFQRSKEEADIDPDDLTKTKAPNEKPGTMNQKSSADDAFGGDLDVPGSELDDEREKVGNEDEENNSYSLGADEQNEPDETK